MSSRLTCLHGHKLESPLENRAEADYVCPLCGSLAELKRSAEINVDVNAATVVPFTAENSKPAATTHESSPSATATGSTNPLSTPNQRGSRTSANSPTVNFDPSRADSSGNRMFVLGGTNSSDFDPDAATNTSQLFEPPALAGIEIMGELGRGGMGVVYEAYDERHGRDVALKTLQRMGPDDIVRFKQEFRALSDIAHTNLASLYELLSDGNTWCFTMEILEGVEFLDYVWAEFDSLNPTSRPRMARYSDESPRLTRRRMNRLYESLKQLAMGLHELHRVGKLHSDIKPSNVFVTTEGRLVLLDFGLIAEINPDQHGHRPRTVQGTPNYMSPEQAACEPLSAASDWYAVGVMLYEVLTGQLPVHDKKSVRTMMRKLSEVPVEPIVRCPDTPKELNDLCMALLEIKPENRPSAADVLRAVDAEDAARTIQESQSLTAIRSVDLVGRETHFEVLNQAFSDVANGETRSVFVHGRSGMGKSVLIRSFIDGIGNHDKTIVLEGRCYEQESVPFKALDTLIDSLVIYLGTLSADSVYEILPDDMLPLARLFPVLGQIEGLADQPSPSIDNADQQELRQRAMIALRELLTRLSQRGPIVFYIDDLQWGDEDSANLLADLMRPPDSPRMLLVGSYRREDIDTSPSLRALSDAWARGKDQPHRCELRVNPLSIEDARRLASMLLQRSDDVGERFAERIAQESGGSPFFVWELAQHIQDETDISVGSLELDEVIWTRVLRLPTDTRRLLEVFAVAGRPMRAAEAYQAIDDMTHGPGLLAQLRTSNFVRTKDHDDDTIVETYHDRIRESVVNHLANAKVRGHYLKLASVIEQAANFSLSDVQSHINKTSDFAEPDTPFQLDKNNLQRVFDLAYFYDAAKKPERAMPYALIAAERAWQQNAFDVAQQQFEIARRGEESASDAIRFRIAEGLGDVLMIRAQYDRADQQFQTARSLASDTATLARIDGKRGALCFKQGDMANSIKHLDKALTELGNPPSSNNFIQTAALLKEGWIQLLHTYLPGWFTGRRSADNQEFRMDMFRARTYEGLGYPYWFSRGPVPTLWTHLRHMNLAERYPPTPELGRAYAMHAIMMTAIPLAERGVAYAERSFQIHSELGDRLGRGKARSFQTFSLLALGRFREAVESGREAVQLLEQAGDVWEANMSRIIVSQPLYFLGELENSHLEAKRAFEIGTETGDYSAIAIALYFWVPAFPDALPEGALQAERERPREDPLSTSAAIQGRGLELLFREDNPVEAAKVIQESLDVARKRGLRNPCIFGGVTWKASALRIAAEREPEGPSRKAALTAAKKAGHKALRITRKYLTMRPRALRERAVIAIMEGHESTALRYLDDSRQVAEQQESPIEQAQTLLTRGQAGMRFGWADAEQQITAATEAINRMEAFRSKLNT